MNPMTGNKASVSAFGYGAKGADINQTCDTYAGLPRTDTPIRDAVSAVEQALAEAHSGLSAVTERLDVVLRPSCEPVHDKVPTTSPRGRTHLEARLVEVADAVRSLNARLQELHGRIDV